MTVSQNVVFVGLDVIGAPEHPRGIGIARLTSEKLHGQGYNVTQLENWRDCGWSFSLLAGEATIEIVVSSLAKAGEWIIQVSSADRPGPLARLFGSKKIDRSSELFDVASAVHQILAAGGFSNLRWCGDGFPDPRASSPEPRR